MKVYILSISLMLLSLLSGCGQENSSKITCGTNAVDIKWRVRHNDPNSSKFAILLNGSPATNYFGDHDENTKRLTETLLEKGFKTFEVKYPGSLGFYSACQQQGLHNVSAHCSSLYDLAIKALGFDPNNPAHKMIGVGWSLGAIQLQAMSFMHNKRIDNIALTGVLLGNVAKGCESAVKGKYDGYSWRAFDHLAALLTTNGQGCGRNTEFTDAYNFEKQKYFTKWNLGIFEGKEITSSYNWTAGNLAQAKYIEKVRKDANAPVELFEYDNCGHELMACTRGKVVDDIIGFITK